MPAKGSSEPDLCYACAQREKRNVYVDLSSERKKRHQRYDQLMWDYQKRKNYIAMQREQEAKREAIQYSKCRASYNLDKANEKVGI